MQETLAQFLGREVPWRRDRLPTPAFLGFPCGSAGKESTCNVGDLGSIPGLGRSPREGKGSLLQYSGLENSMDCIVHGVAKSQTQLRDFHLLLYLPRVLGGLNGRCIYMLGFPGGSAGKESTCNTGDLGSISELGTSPGEGNSYLLQYSGLEKSMNCIVHGAARSHD